MDKIIENIDKGIANGKAKALANSKLNDLVIKPCSCGRQPRRCLNAEGTLGRLYCDYCCRAAWEFKPTFATMEEMIKDWDERAL